MRRLFGRIGGYAFVFGRYQQLCLNLCLDGCLSSTAATRRCRCDVWGAGQREYIAAQRARKRALRPLPAQALAEPVSTETTSTAGAETVGPVVAAVQAELATLGTVGRQGLAAAAIAMARILDHPGAVTTQPAAARQLMSLLDVLHREAAPPRGRLAVVQAMSVSSRPDAR